MRGWLLDLYSESPGKMVVWMKLESGETKRLVDRWANSFFVAADDKRDLAAIESGRTWRDEFSWSRRVMRYERATDIQESEVLELVVDDARKLPRLAGRIERSMPFGTYRIYNVDVPQEQMYLYENDLVPLAECEVSETRDGLAWELRDDIWSCKYTVPELRSLGVRPEIERSGRLPRFDDPIRSIELKHCDGSASVIDGESEADKLLTFVEEVRRADPDIIFTNDGDAFVLPYLAKRASVNGIAEKFSIDREGKVLEAPAKKGTTYFSYGKILFKPSAVKLLGRIHLDTTSSFVQRETGLDGFYEVSRVCRLPLHTASRASIGKALSSLQFYYATKDGILIPWKPALAESFKTRAELLVGDRGGFIFEPELGVHEQIGELDFSSLFPSIMAKKNISPETVRCGCCPDSSNRVPELDWNVCERRPEGIVAKSVKILVEKKMKYKRLEQIAKTERERASYHARRDALKWTSVACLPRGSPILIRQDGIDRYERIGDFIDGLVGKREGVIECPSRVYTPGVGSDYKTRYCKIARLIKKPNDQKLLSFVMEGGRKIVTTPNHPFFILDGGKLVVKEATELRGGDLVPVGRAIPPANEIKQVDLIEKLENLLLSKEKELWRVSGEKLKEAIKAKLPTLLRAAAQEGYSNGGVISWSKSGIIPLKFFGLLELNPLVHRSLRVGPGRRQGGRIAWLPAILDIDERLGFFLGFYVADGSATGNMVRLDVALSEPELLETLVKLVESLFKISPHVSKEKRARMWVIQINSAGLVRILEKVFGQPGSSDNGKLKVPDVILNGSAEAAHRFMAGMLAGDGNAGKRKRYVQISTKSKELQNQICFLAARLRLAFRMKTEREDDRTMYTVAFVGPETLGRIGNWEYSKEGQREKIQSWSKESPPATCTHAIYDRLPIEESGLFALAKSTRTSSDPHTRKELRQCPAIVESLLGRDWFSHITVLATWAMRTQSSGG
jgi:intein/homing endonuclease